MYLSIPEGGRRRSTLPTPNKNTRARGSIRPIAQKLASDAKKCKCTDSHVKMTNFRRKAQLGPDFLPESPHGEGAPRIVAE